MPDNNLDKIEAQLQSLAESDDLVKWLSDVDLSKYVIDWLEAEGVSGWKVKLAVKIVSLLVVNAGKYGGSAITEIARERFVGFLKKSEKVKAVLEKLEDLRKMTNQQIAAQEGLKELLKGNIDRASGNIEHRESLSLDIQAHLEELDRLHDIGSELEALKAQLSEQPEFVNPNTTGTEINKFVYRSQYIPFAGREKEIDFLESFLNSKRMFSWQALIGPGGVGKSRLGLEFCLQHGVGFRSGVLDDFDFSFKKWQPCQPTLLVVDYTSKERDKLQSIIKFLTNRETKHECKIRLLILDRDSSDHQLNSLSEHRHTRDSRFKEPYLLKQPDPAIAKSIFEFFFEKENQAIPASWDELLKRLESIDADMRPLFAAYLGSAVAKGEGDRHFNRESLLQDVIRREIEDMMEPCGVTEKDLALLALATMVGGISTENNFTLPECVTSFQELIHAKNRFKALNCRVVEDPETSQKIQVIPPWEPDLVGELFVLDFLKDDVDTGVNRYRRDILNAAWDGAPKSIAVFLDRCRQDYFDHTGFDVLVMQPQQLNPFSIRLWAMLFVNLIFSYGEANQFGRIEELYADLIKLYLLPEAPPEIVLEHAKAACNMIKYYGEAAKLDRAEEFYADLIKLSSMSEAHSEIVLEYGSAASNLIICYINNDQLDRAGEIYVDLVKLSSMPEVPPQIVLFHANAVSNLIICYINNDQLDRAEEIYADLVKLSSMPEVSPQIVLEYGSAALNLIIYYIKNDHLDRAEEIYADLVKLSSMSTAPPQIVLLHANADFNLLTSYINNDRLDRAEEIYADLVKLSSLLEAPPEVVLGHAKAAVNLINGYGKGGRFVRVEELYADLAKLSSLPEAPPEIALEYAKAAFNLMIHYFHLKEGQAREQELYANLRDLSSTHATPEIEIQYIKGTGIMALVALNVKDQESAHQHLSKFRNMCKKYPDNPELSEVSDYVESQLKDLPPTS
ncbi:hypothetical protein [Maridesulfovibrio sp.]|uniref:hypothetical protein n=1 Tax=Maridesulfovibrio sp. TaxID=2795000 RepID=UPI003AFFB3CE